jgi:hypothetical protein
MLVEESATRGHGSDGKKEKHGSLQQQEHIFLKKELIYCILKKMDIQSNTRTGSELYKW